MPQLSELFAACQPPEPPDNGLNLEALEAARDKVILRMIEAIPKVKPRELPAMLKTLDERIAEKRAKIGPPEEKKERGTFNRAKALEILQGRRVQVENGMIPIELRLREPG